MSEANFRLSRIERRGTALIVVLFFSFVSVFVMHRSYRWSISLLYITALPPPYVPFKCISSLLTQEEFLNVYNLSIFICLLVDSSRRLRGTHNQILTQATQVMKENSQVDKISHGRWKFHLIYLANDY